MLKLNTSENQIENSDDKGKTKVQKPDQTDQLCSKCGQYFTSLIDLACHFFKEHNKLGEGFDCPMCPKIISTRERSKEHIRSVHFNETKKCPDCKQIYALSNYTKHRRLVHGVRRHKIGQSHGKPLPSPTSAGYECPDCKKVLRSKGSKYILNYPSNK